MTPTENHAAMQLPFGANASRLAAFTGKLIDIAFHQSGTLESHLERRLQFLQGIAQGGPPAAELVEGCFLLHATTIYRIQIRAPQSEKSTPLSKMFSDDQARFALAGFRKELIAVSESQIELLYETCQPRVVKVRQVRLIERRAVEQACIPLANLLANRRVSASDRVGVHHLIGDQVGHTLPVALH